METRLTQDRLAQIVREVERLQQRREAELDPEQVKQILLELNLSPDLLDEALLQLRRREALADRNRKKQWIVGGAIAAILAGVAFTAFFSHQHQQAIARVTVQQDRLTFSADDGGNLTVISRNNSPEIFYRVTLNDAPIGKKLSLSCDWIDPTGTIVKQNHYSTREIDKTVWNTYCRHQFGSASLAGNWQVRMFLEESAISDAFFGVE